MLPPAEEPSIAPTPVAVAEFVGSPRPSPGWDAVDLRAAPLMSSLARSGTVDRGRAQRARYLGDEDESRTGRSRSRSVSRSRSRSPSPSRAPTNGENIAAELLIGAADDDHGALREMKAAMERSFNEALRSALSQNFPGDPLVEELLGKLSRADDS